MKIKLFSILFVFIFLSSCRKDNLTETEVPQTPISETNYTKKVYGEVVDLSGELLSDVMVTLGSKEVFTDKNGLFILDDVKVSDIKGKFVTVEKDGFFRGGARVYANSLEQQFVRVVLVEKNWVGSFDAATGGTIVANENLEITFEPQGIKNELGDIHVGNVNVYAYYLNPAEDGFLQISPGDLSAVNSEGDPGTLLSYGMVAVELYDQSGNLLNIADGKEAQLKVKVPDELISAAPQQIPLWYFDEEINQWKEEGAAQYQDGYYLGNVSHFSWWNCDDFVNGINLCIQLVQPARNSFFSQVEVTLFSNNFGLTSAFTDEDGYLCGLVPYNEELTIKIYRDCGELLYEGVIGPYTMDATEYINASLGNIEYYTFEGEVIDCANMTPIVDATVRLNVSGNNYYTQTDQDGEYSFSRLLCDPNVDYNLLAIDYLNATSGYLAGNANTGVISDLDIELCDVAPFFILKDKDDNVIMDELECSLKVKPFETIVFAGSLQDRAYLGVAGNDVGSFGGVFNPTLSNLPSTPYTTSVNITQWNNVGGIIRGNFEGIDNNGQVVFIGSFAALRTE